MDDSDSSLSSAPPTDDEKLAPIFKKMKVKTKKVVKPAASPPPPSPPRRKRTPSPPHIESLADNPHVAFVVMFRSRFSAAFPPKLAHFGPQDVERGVEDSVPSPMMENYLCALLGLVLNRKKPVERGHHGRALEEAVSSHRSQWPRSWAGINPLHGNQTFHTMSASTRLDLLRTLVIWALTSSEIISQTIKDQYKQTRHEDDLNQPLSVQPWGFDGDKRRYWLIEGQDDTSFRLYRESPRSDDHNTWWSIAGSIEEVKAVSDRLEKDGTQAARRLSSRILAAIPRFEATEEKRKRREYRQIRKQQFIRPEPGFSLYEGRTRGKRMRYTFDEEDGDDIDELGPRRSGRHSDRSTPNDGPTVTASGRTVRPRGGGMYGESLLSGQATDATTPATNDYEDSEMSEMPRTSGRVNRASGRLGELNGERKRKQREGYNEVDQMSDEEDAASSAGWNSDDNEEDAQDDIMDEDEEDDGLSEEDLDLEPQSLVVKLKVRQLENANLEQKAPKTEGSATNGMGSPVTKLEPDSMMRGPENDEDVLGYIPPPQKLDVQLPDPQPKLAEPLQHNVQTTAINGHAPPSEPLTSAEKSQVAPVAHDTITANGSKLTGEKPVTNGNDDVDTKMEG
ncbi:hypothetical protein MBLNU457_1679t1 [Dothideomycetes sp. NU457]